MGAKVAAAAANDECVSPSVEGVDARIPKSVTMGYGGTIRHDGGIDEGDGRGVEGGFDGGLGRGIDGRVDGGDGRGD